MMKKLFVLLCCLLTAFMIAVIVLGVAAGKTPVEEPLNRTAPLITAEDFPAGGFADGTAPPAALEPPATTEPLTAGGTDQRAVLPEGAGAADAPAEAYYRRGIARAFDGEMEGAIADFSEAIRLGAGYVEAYYNRGYLYLYHEKKYDLAMADLNAVIGIDPGFALAYYDRGNLYMYTGETDRAIADFGEAIRLKADYAAAYVNRGVVYAGKKDYGRARADFEQALRIDPGDADARNNLAYLRNMGH
jgi:tetratricopeptide (TPR) repeat protein